MNLINLSISFYVSVEMNGASFLPSRELFWYFQTYNKTTKTLLVNMLMEKNSAFLFHDMQMITSEDTGNDFGKK